VFVVDTVASGYLRYHSFNFHRTSVIRILTIFPFRPLSLLSSYRSPAKSLTYWHRLHTSKTRLPILFIHGIGIGLYPYVDFLAGLNAASEMEGLDGELGIIAVEIMPISFRITGRALSNNEMCQEIQHILDAHKWERFVLVSHS
jgi:hypothetical protein